MIFLVGLVCCPTECCPPAILDHQIHFHSNTDAINVFFTDLPHHNEPAHSNPITKKPFSFHAFVIFKRWITGGTVVCVSYCCLRHMCALLTRFFGEEVHSMRMQPELNYTHDEGNGGIDDSIDVMQFGERCCLANRLLKQN